MCDYFEVLLCTHKYRGLFNCCQSVCCLINLLPSQRVLGLKGRAPESQIDFCVGDEGCAVLHAKHSPAVATGALTQDPLAQGCAWSVQQWSHGCHRPQTCNSHELLTGGGGGDTKDMQSRQTWVVRCSGLTVDWDDTSLKPLFASDQQPNMQSSKQSGQR